MKLSLRLQILCFTTTVLVTLDQWTKELAIEHLKGAPTASYLNGFLKILYSENPGAFLGFGAHFDDATRKVLFIILVAAMLVGLVIYLLKAQVMNRLTAFSLALVFSGGLGNFIDRAFREGGRVIDFLNIGVGSVRTGIFNVADMAITAGTIVLIFFSAKPPKK